ncbi:MAG: 4Fe-4S dicluster domain-containing protein [Chloroflexi bacterium]|nr:4Fe-4S dicluster domain-containing protein [Chloroflexota bacterium]
MVTQQDSPYDWGMVVDVDRCTGCQACVIACQAENNVPLNTENLYKEQRTYSWIRVERYWEGEFPNVKARFIPIMCQHCGNAPCEPVCPVFATYHNTEGLNVQVYNRCVGTRYCAIGCPYNVRFFNYWEPVWPEALRNQLNPDVTIRSRGIMEKCSFCIQRIRRAERLGRRENRLVADGEIQTACSQACPTNALTFGNLKDPDSKVSRLSKDRRHYKLLDEKIGTDPNVIYLARVEEKAEAVHG